MDRLPLVTIITPAYNRGSFLEETIQSVISQDYPHIECIVLDDGSTDDTRDVLRNYNGRLYWESHPNMGETRTVNKGFSMAKGEIIGVVNSDDPLLPGAVSTIVDAMEGSPETVAAYPDWKMIDVKGDLIQQIETYEYSYLNMVRWHHCVPGPGTFFRRSVVERLGGRDVQFRYVGDFDFWLRAGLTGPFKRVPKTLATFRWHSDGASSKDQGLTMAEEHILLVRKVFSLAHLPPEVRSARREAYGSACYVAAVVLAGSSPELKRRYFAKAFASSPIKYLFEYRERLLCAIAPAFFGRTMCSILRKCDSLFPLKNKSRCPL